MSGYPVNKDPSDGKCKWNLFLPLGLNNIGQRGILLMHYPPWQVLQQATFMEVMTMHRWNTVLQAAGVPKEQVSFYRTIVDVNPIAAPGSGQSEYPNDYFPIMAASVVAVLFHRFPRLRQSPYAVPVLFHRAQGEINLFDRVGLVAD